MFSMPSVSSVSLSRVAFGTLPVAVVVLLAAGLPGPRVARADATGDMARSLLERNKGAAITCTVVIKVAGGPNGEESNGELEVEGVVIDASGLIVVPNTSIDPTSLFASIAGEGAIGNVTSKVVSVRILTTGSAEIPAKVVLRDTDRNLAFLRPITAPATPLPFVDLKTAGKAQAGEAVFVLGRMGKTGNRGAEVGFTRVTGTIERPRLTYVVQPLTGAGSPGNLVFNEQGQPLGLLGVKLSVGRRSGFGGQDVLQIVVPVEDILEIGAQAPQAKDVRDETVPAKATPAKLAAPAKKPAK
ncbi:MAG: trypsin-like peptidase domain-containing protein [Cytophagales bacterium]|nr:trypsin-like peptidase domain-containing protein [Armatimonadota bacterium]